MNARSVATLDRAPFHPSCAISILWSSGAIAVFA
jgi:hypothetical protein